MLRYDPIKGALNEDLNKRVKLQMQLRTSRDQMIEGIEVADRRLAVLKKERGCVADGAVRQRQIDAEMRQLYENRARAQEILFQYADRLEREEAHLEELRKVWIHVHNSREMYAASEKLPPLWFRLVIVTFWAVAILILIGILPRG